MQAPRQHLRSALFVDFDNVYIGLNQQERDAARIFATSPEYWLRWLEEQLTTEHFLTGERLRRRILMRRCYLNPRSFQTFRPYFIHAAFEVVDCPPLTRQGKTSADIHLVIDALDAIDHATVYDEFIIFSADADFTPVLRRMRTHDRRTVALAVGASSAAYRAASDLVIDQDAFVSALLAYEADKTKAKIEAKPDRRSSDSGREKPSRPKGESREDVLTRVAESVREWVRSSKSAMNLSRLVNLLRRRYRAELGDDWMGHGSFGTLIDALDLGGIERSAVDPGYLYDPELHEAPVAIEEEEEAEFVEEPEFVEEAEFAEEPEFVEEAAFAEEPAAFAEEPAEEAAPEEDEVEENLIDRICRLTDTPRLEPETYRDLFGCIADEVNEEGYDFMRTPADVRDRLAAHEGTDRPRVGRGRISFILRGIATLGHRYQKGEERPEQLADLFARHVVTLAGMAQLELSPDDVQRVREWIGAPEREEPLRERGGDGLAREEASVQPDAQPEPAQDAGYADEAPAEPAVVEVRFLASACEVVTDDGEVKKATVKATTEQLRSHGGSRVQVQYAEGGFEDRFTKRLERICADAGYEPAKKRRRGAKADAEIARVAEEA